MVFAVDSPVFVVSREYPEFYMNIMDSINRQFSLYYPKMLRRSLIIIRILIIGNCVRIISAAKGTQTMI